MVNNSKNWLKFTWPNDASGNKHECITFLPSIGYLAPNSTKQINV